MIYLQEYVPPVRKPGNIPRKRKSGFHQRKPGMPVRELGKVIAFLLAIVILLQGVTTINSYEKMYAWGNAWSDAWMQATELK